MPSSRCFPRLGRSLLTAAIVIAAFSNVPIRAATFTVTVFTDSVSGDLAGTGVGAAGDLRAQILAANAAGGSNAIAFSCVSAPCTITLGGPLPAITSNLTIDGGVYGDIIIDGASSYRVFFVDTGTVAISNLVIQNGKAIGGAGGTGDGGGGGGAGLGGGLFVNQAAAAVTLTNVKFLNCSAAGGKGGNFVNTNYAGGGGGGLAFRGGNSTNNTGGAGGGGVLAQGADASIGRDGGAGGAGGGGGGGFFAPSTVSGAGGSAYATNTAGSTGSGGAAGAGGFGGGGGGSALGTPGAGGFGGGGGGTGTSNTGAAGGAGGGGGASGGGSRGAGGSLGSGVSGGNAGAGVGGGGGGAAAGPAVFVRLGSLTTSNSVATGSTATAGVGGTGNSGPSAGASGTSSSTSIFNFGGTVNSAATPGPNTALDPVTTSVAGSAIPPSVSVGQTVTLSATVTTASGTLAGTVAFLEGATSLGSAAAIDGSGVASLSGVSLALGQHTITANFTPAASDLAHGASTTTFAVTVTSPVPTVGTPSVSGPLVYGQSRTFSVTVTGSIGTPTGSVTFLDGTAPVGVVTLVSGAASLASSTLTAGSHSITVQYGGDSSYVSGTSAALPVTINKASTATALVVSDNNLIATISAVSPGSGTPTGSVRFLNGTTVLGTTALVGATATFSAAPGSVTAAYLGDGNFNGSTSAAVVVYAPATTSLSMSANVALPTLGQAVTFSVAVETSGGPPNSAAPNGTVKFFEGATLLGTGAVSSNRAAYTMSFSSGGSHIITAVYSGDAIFPSAQTTYEANVYAPVTITATAAPGAPVYGQPVTLSAMVAASQAGYPAPTGTVTFLLPGAVLSGASTPLGSSSVSDGLASLTLSNLAVGSRYIVVKYSGDAIWSQTLTQVTLTVSPAATNSSVSLAMVSGAPVLTSRVSVLAPGSGAPSGSVQFVDTSNGAVIASAALSSGKAEASLPVSATAFLSGRPIAAAYSGDGNFAASTSAALPAIVNAASFRLGAFAADDIASVFGVSGLQRDTAATIPLKTSLDGVSISITDAEGTLRQAPIYGVFASAGQVNFVVPAGAVSGPAVATVTLPGGGSLSTVILITGAAPGIFVANAEGFYSGQIVYVHRDGSQTVASSVLFKNGAPASNPIDLSVSGDQVFLTLYGTGLRHGGSLTASVNGAALPVTYFGAQQDFPGLDQINLGPLPASLAGAGQVKIALSADAQAANEVIAVIR
jgi:hypothetical protein